MLTLLLALAPVWGYAHCDPNNPPQGGPHRQINTCAWDLFLTTRIREAERTDPVLQHYQLKNDAFRELTGSTVLQPGNWPDDLVNGDSSMTVPLWIAEGGYTADEPEIFACLRHFYDPTAREGERYLTDIAWIGRFRESVRGTWRRDVETQNPRIDARAWALSRGENPYGWQQGVAAMRQALGPGDLTQAQRDKLAAAAWRSLGETMHLLADMTVPAHVRNDGHPGALPAGDLRPDPYESWIGAPEVQAAYASIPRTGGWQKLDPSAAMDDEAAGALAAGTPEALFHAVASYTNRQFLTADTLTGTDPAGKPVTPLNGKVYPSPVLGRDCVWDEGAGTYNKGFQRREPVMMAKGTWQSSTWSSLAQKIGITLAGGKLAFATSRDCAVSQGLVLLPIAITGGAQLIDWFLPRVTVRLNKLDLRAPGQPFGGEVVHKPHGAYATPIEITLAKDATIDLYLDGVPQDRREYTITVEKGKLAGTVDGIDLARAKRIWVELDIAGIRVASPPYSPEGTVRVRVCKPKELVNETNPMHVLGGAPIEDAEVVLTYSLRGKPMRLEGRTNKEGGCRFSVPLDTEVTVHAVGETRTVTCTAEKPEQVAEYGWQGHDPFAEGR